MKYTFTENEAVLLITGDILIAIGGVILGITFENTLLRFYLAPLCAIFFGLGGFFDYKSIRTFSRKLNILKEAIKEAHEQLDKTMNDVKTSTENLKETNKALFGRETGTFSGIKWYNSVDDQLKDLKREIKKLEDKIQDINYKMSHRR